MVVHQTKSVCSNSQGNRPKQPETSRQMMGILTVMNFLAARPPALASSSQLVTLQGYRLLLSLYLADGQAFPVRNFLYRD